MTQDERRAAIVVLALSAALLAAPWRGHVDDVDAQLYTVVARHMAADRAWLDLRYLPDLLPVFREHLPFGFWPAAAAIRLAGEPVVNPVYALFTLCTVALVGFFGTRIAGTWAGVGAAFALGTCESMWQYGGRLLLEPPLLLFATGAAGAALLPRPRWSLAALCGAVAVLIKGPFGVLPLAAAVLARSASERSTRVLMGGLAAGVFSALPACAFLLWNRYAGDGTWWRGYVEEQLLASASGGRADGITSWWFPLRVIVGRFWPGLLLLAAGLPNLRRDSVARTLALSCVIAAALLCIPHRKWGNHVYVAFPLLALCAGAMGRRLIGWIFERRVAMAILGVAAAAGWVASIAGAGRLVLQPPCVVSAEFATELNAIPPNSPALVVSGAIDWPLVGELAAERWLVPRPVGALPEVPTDVALARDPVQIPPAWREAGRARSWVILRPR